MANIVIRSFIDNNIIDAENIRSMLIKYDHNTGLFYPEHFHLTLFKIDFKLGNSLDFLNIFGKYSKQEYFLECNYIDLSTRG